MTSAASRVRQRAKDEERNCFLAEQGRCVSGIINCAANSKPCGYLPKPTPSPQPSPPMGERESERRTRFNSLSHAGGEGQDEGDPA
jgi:hypothetical protein